MLASSLREEAQATVSNKPGHRGEREVSRKTIARGMPGVSGVTVVTTLVCFVFITHEAAGASSARHFLRPLISGRMVFAKTRTHRAARMRAHVCKQEPSLRAKRSNPSRRGEGMDCFVASLLAMTGTRPSLQKVSSQQKFIP
jgi:hypothetical protein